MKAEELMIDDWVAETYKGIDCNTYKVNKYVSVSSFGEAKSFDPIPITPEILEQNGFIYDKEKDLLTCWVGNSFIDCDTNTGYFMIVNKGRSYEGVIDYVHELQHALRLCKIDKEIEL